MVAEGEVFVLMRQTSRRRVGNAINGVLLAPLTGLPSLLVSPSNISHAAAAAVRALGNPPTELNGKVQHASQNRNARAWHSSS